MFGAAHVSDVQRLSVSAEARGLARDFCRRVGVEARMINQQGIGDSVRRRFARYPDRPPREDLLRDLERRWRNASPQQFRLRFDCTRKGRDIFIIERAVTVIDAFRLPHWASDDYGVTVTDTWFEVHRGQPDAGIRSRMWIGSHALARWYQRSGSRSDVRLLEDISCGASLELDDRGIFEDLDDIKVSVNQEEAWRGSLMVAPPDEGDHLVFYVRTFF
jgi:hypothetical protein